MTTDQSIAALESGASSRVASVWRRAALITLAGLRKLQPLLLIVALIASITRLRVFLDDSLLGDRWFSIQHSNLWSVVIIWVAPFALAGLGTALFSPFLKRFFPANGVHLFILPALLGLLWYENYTWAKSYPAPYPAMTFKSNGKVGCKNAAGVILLEAIYEDVKCFGFEEPLTIAHLSGNGGDDYIPVKKGKWGFIDRGKKMVIAPQFDDVYVDAHWGLRPVQKDGKWGFIHARTGTIAIPFEYDGADSFAFADGMASPLAPVEKNGKWGYIDRQDQARIPFQFDDAEPFWMTNLYDTWDREKASAKMAPMRRFWKSLTDFDPHSPAWSKVRIGNLWGIIDSTGHVVLQASIPGPSEVPLHCDTRTSRCYWDGPYERDTHIQLSVATRWMCQGTANRSTTAPLSTVRYSLGGHPIMGSAHNCEPISADSSH